MAGIRSAPDQKDHDYRAAVKGRETSFRRLARNFRRATAGSAAIEFGFAGVIFMAIFCFWIELGLTVFMQTSLDNATRDVARLVKIGTVKTSADFASALCTDLSSLMTCSLIKYNVVSGSSFASLSTAVTVDSQNQLTGTHFVPGTSGQDVVVQVAYTRPLVMPIVNAVLGRNGSVLLVSTLAFQNEPF